MCYAEGKLVDSDANQYPEHLLREWKRGAEAAARQAMEAPRGKAAHAIDVSIHLPVSPRRPRVVPQSVRGSQLYRVIDRQYLFYVLQLWFETDPAAGSVTAHHLTGTLTFLRDGNPLFDSVQSEWAIANAADNVGFSGTTEILERLLPIGERGKLLVLQKRTDDDVAYAWSRGAAEYKNRQHPSHQIPPGRYELRVRIRGIDIDETFRFLLTNPGAGGDPEIAAQIEYA